MSVEETVYYLISVTGHVIPSVRDNETGELQVHGQPGQFNEPLSQNKTSKDQEGRALVKARRKPWVQFLILPKKQSKTKQNEMMMAQPEATWGKVICPTPPSLN